MLRAFLLSLVSCLALLVSGCYGDLDPVPAAAPYTFATVDANGGKWKPVYIQDVTTFAVAAPATVASAAYQGELAQLKQLSQNLSAAQRGAIDKWGANGLVHWNEIARTLAAKYNLPPAANADGTYPIPNASNPGIYPYFPFSNPVYSSRMYAYWSVAQYDALVATWHYKYLYNRAAPYTNDANVTPALPRQELPAYPSEDAVIAAVSKEILTAMFPLEAAYLTEQMTEHRNSRLWAGMNTESDLAAGEALGKAIATQILSLSKTDGMKNAVGTPFKWDSLQQEAARRLGWAWQSLETPKRPPMLPFFGKVRPWCIPGVEVVRPPAPPAIGSAEFEKAVQELKDLSKNLTAEQRRIANFWGDGVSTYTPPGHWNRAASDELIEGAYNPLRTARVYAYLNMALMDAGISCWDTKTHYFYPRPAQTIANFRTLLGTPNFPSYTSGHSTFSASAAAVLSHFFPQRAASFNAMAKEASESRIYGGIHYRFDCEAGLTTGAKIGEYVLKAAKADGGE